MLDRRDQTQLAMAQLIFAELGHHDVAPFDLPLPSGALTRRVAASLVDHPAIHEKTTVIARRFGVSARTLERRFLNETGLTFGRWHRHARMLAALRALASGASVKQVALSSGYSEPSAFIAAFKAAFGRTPGWYFAVNS
jgi:AraC-like DNA-binding protein